MKVTSKLVPSALWASMMIVIILAALVPNSQAVPAQSDCQYGNCVTIDFGQPTVWTWIAVAIIFLLGLAVGWLVHRRRGIARQSENETVDPNQPG